MTWDQFRAGLVLELFEGVSYSESVFKTHRKQPRFRVCLECKDDDLIFTVTGDELDVIYERLPSWMKTGAEHGHNG